MTVDLGREGRLYDERYATNRMSIESYHGLAGEDAGDVEDENLAVIKRRLAKLEVMNKAAGTSFEYFDIWPRTSNAQPAMETGAPDPTNPNDMKAQFISKLLSEPWHMGASARGRSSAACSCG
jgi:hypothetical protein